MRRWIALFAVLTLFLAACGNDDDSAEEATAEATTAPEEPEPASTPAMADNTPAAEEPEVEESEPGPFDGSTPEPAVDPEPVPVQTSDPVERPEPENLDDPAFNSADKLSTVGLGSVYFGMTPEEAADAITTLWTGGPGEGSPRCYLLAPASGPSGVVLTVYNSSIERVDITNSSITTRSGASVGSTEAQLHELFGEQLVVSPYADGSGNSIQFVPVDEADADYRVIWETDGTSVTSMRAGRLPAVQPTEPCGPLS